MSNVVVDGFAAYGTGNVSAAVKAAMLAGAYAEIGTSVTTNVPGSCQVQMGLPWDATDTSFWLNGRNDTGGANSGLLMAARRVLPEGAETTVVISCRISMTALPTGLNDGIILDLRDGTNAVMGQLGITSTGILYWQPHGLGPALSSSGPVIVAEKATHIEGKWNMSTHAVEVRVDEVVAVTGTATYDNAANVAQFCICGVGEGGGLEHAYVHMTDLIVRNTSGTFNNDFVGDRHVATLFPNADDPTNDGWTPEPLERFGVGILNLTDSGSLACVGGPANNVGDIGAGDFTIEGNFRLQAPPTGTNKSVLFGKWIEDSNQRSYQLYQGGPTLENGILVFRTSTNGLSGTVVEKLKWPWNPVTEQWYHIAVARASNVLRLFINGVQAGVDVADTDTYFAGTERTVLGGQVSSINQVIVGTTWIGWQDEFRLTIGACRYTTNFAPPTGLFPRGAIADPDWTDVAWLSGWDNSSIADDGPNGITLTAFANATFMTPNDNAAAYQTINKPIPSEDTFIEAALLPGTGVLTFSGGNAANTETVTCATKNGTIAAVYTFKTVLASAFDVLVGATAADSINNLIAAINLTAGAGTIYGTGTTANNDVVATLLPSVGQMLVTAFVPGTAGNALATTETCAHASWSHTTLTGGVDIPDPSAFFFQPLPPKATIVDSVTFVGREYKTDAGTAKTKQTMLGIGGGTLPGTEYTMGTVPALKFDLFEEDPDNPGDPLNPTIVRTMRVLIDRTV